MIASKNYIAIVGPTASGKSDLAMEMALKYDGEIISCDSVQVYKGFDIGSAKPSKKEQSLVPHHLIDMISWNESYDAARYREEAKACIKEVKARGHLPIVVGGTGLYLRALWGYGFHDLPSDESTKKELQTLSTEELLKKLKQLDPERAQQLHPNDRIRLARACEVALLSGSSLTEQQNKSVDLFPPQKVIFCQRDKKELDQRIVIRTQEMLAQGLVDETAKILAQGCPQSAKPMQTIGYKQACSYLAGDISEEELEEKIIIATRQYAKRQMTWFRKLPETDPL